MNPWKLLKETLYAFFNDGVMSDGAAIAFYTITSLGPLLFIVIAVAGIVFGEDAARGAIYHELGGMMGKQSADLLSTVIANARGQTSGLVATVFGFIALFLTATGVFTQMQATLNRIWKAEPSGAVVTEMIKVRAVSLGLVAALGFLLVVSLILSAMLTAFAGYVNAILPFGHFILEVGNFFVSYLLITLMFAAIYKVLPDKRIEWQDVLIGATATALLFTIGKFLIALYIGSTAVASSYGAAGSLMVVLLWIYYSAQIFLIGAEFTKVFAHHHGSHVKENG